MSRADRLGLWVLWALTATWALAALVAAWGHG